MIDNAKALTYVTSSGTGTQINLDDVRYFTDGWGIIEGDLISFEGNNKIFMILDIDYDNDIITLNESISYTANQEVYLQNKVFGKPVNGKRDIGAYEYQ